MKWDEFDSWRKDVLSVENDMWILDGNTERKTLGSMANVWKALLELDSTIEIGLSPINVGHALVYVDRLSAQRYSKVNLNLVKYQEKIFNSKIHHLIYLNEIFHEIIGHSSTRPSFIIYFMYKISITHDCNSIFNNLLPCDISVV